MRAIAVVSLALGLFSALAGYGSTAAASPPRCGLNGLTCDAQATGNALRVGGDLQQSGRAGEGVQRGDHVAPATGTYDAEAERRWLAGLSICIATQGAAAAQGLPQGEDCFGSEDETNGSTNSTAIPAVTAADLASFSPDPPTVANEPAGLGLADAATNFIATAATHEQTGEILGIPVTVRFTPESYTYNYGDDTTATLTDGGTTWDALRQPDFTATPTSHTYTDPGRYTANVTAAYTAEVNFGDGTWHPVEGIVTSAPTPLGIRVVEAHTALVNETCDENPNGTGCPR